MNLQSYIWGYFFIMLALANLPWLSQRCWFVLQCEKKPVWLRLVETLLLFGVALGIGLALENKVMGDNYSQGWEFYWVMWFIFIVFASPGFMYRYIR